MTTETLMEFDLFTLDELRAGLSTILTPESVADVLVGIAAIPAEERGFYRWSSELVLAVGDTSAAVAARVREHYETTPDERERMEDEQRAFHGWRVAGSEDPFRVTLGFSHLVIDTRTAVAGERQVIYAPPAPSSEGEA
jgi:hypothetical protein